MGTVNFATGVGVTDNPPDRNHPQFVGAGCPNSWPISVYNASLLIEKRCTPEMGMNSGIQSRTQKLRMVMNKTAGYDQED